MNLEAIFKQLALELSLIAQGKAQRIGGDMISSGKTEDSILSDPFDRPAQVEPDVSKYVARWERAGTEGQQVKIIGQMRAELERCKISPSKKAGPEKGTMEWREAVAQDSYEHGYRRTARWWGLSFSEIREVREKVPPKT